MDIRQDVVFKILQSMTEKEEKFFVKSARKNTFYFNLYTLVKKKNIFDQKRLIKELEKAGCKQPLHKLKSYLKTEIIQSLIDYNNDNVEINVLKQLSEIKVLILKGLYDEATNTLQTVKAFVIEKGLFHIMPAIYEMDYKLGSLKMDIDPKVFVDYKQCFEDNLVNYRLDYIYYYIKDINFRITTLKENKKVRGEVESLLQDPVMTETNSTESNLIKIKRHNILSLYFLMIADIDKSLKSAYEAIGLLNEFPTAEFYSDMKTLLLRNIIVSLNNFKRKDLLEQEGEKIIEELAELSETNFDALAALMQVKNLQMMSSNDFSELDSNTELFLKKQRLLGTDFRTMLLMNFALLFMKKGDFETALDWLEKVFRFCKKHEQPYKLLGARVISYWVHFRLGNYRILESLQLSIKRQMAGYEMTSEPYNYMVKYTRQYIQAYDTSEQIEVLEKWKKSFNELPFTDKMHFNVISFSFSDYLEEMIENHTAAKVKTL
ncbi:MAG: hypothetical protein EA412_08575 [Chitinophagaceae bacterium]|nr:MAG: hypothetical protein EA412_08575 [Chitinophagaceae bacterium]